MIKKLLGFVLMLGVVAINFGFIAPRTVVASGVISAFSDTVSNLTFNTAANHTISFITPTGVAAGQNIILTFNNGTVTTGVLYTDINVKDNGASLTLGASASGATWGITNASPVITITSGTGTIAAGHTITILIGTNATSPTGVHQIVNGAVGSTILRVSGTFTDVGALSMSIINNSIVAVSAEVLATLTFTISQNALYFGNLNASGPCFAQYTNPGYVSCPTTTEAEAFNMTASTNGTTGYTISVQGDTLRSGLTNTITALAANTASSPGNEQFGLRATVSGSGSGAVQAPYSGAGFAYTGTTSTPAIVASASVPSLLNTYSVRYLANIAATTEAGSYTTAHTYVATGNF